MPHASRDRFQSAEHWQGDKTARHRVLLWCAGLRMWEDYPVFGVGPTIFRFVRAASYPIADRELERLAYICGDPAVLLHEPLDNAGALQERLTIAINFGDPAGGMTGSAEQVERQLAQLARHSPQT